jgi:hypothetical protein
VASTRSRAVLSLDHPEERSRSSFEQEIVPGGAGGDGRACVGGSVLLSTEQAECIGSGSEQVAPHARGQRTGQTCVEKLDGPIDRPAAGEHEAGSERQRGRVFRTTLDRAAACRRDVVDLVGDERDVVGVGEAARRVEPAPRLPAYQARWRSSVSSSRGDDDIASRAWIRTAS